MLLAGEAPLTCADVDAVVAHVELLASREIASTEDRLVAAALIPRYQAEPVATRAALDALAARTAALAAAEGLAAVEARAEAVFSALHEAPLLGVELPGLTGVLNRAVAPWSVDPEARLVLTEMDVEGWIRVVSLGRELQGGGPLRLSVADRVTVYRMVVETFDAAGRPEQLAMVSIGPVWPSFRAAWEAAPYATQQAWAADAGLPPPMTATSLGYAEVMLAGDLTAAALATHEHLGPLRLGVVR